MCVLAIKNIGKINVLKICYMIPTIRRLGKGKTIETVKRDQWLPEAGRGGRGA